MLMNPHGNLHQPPPGSMPPTQYNQYAQMQTMQQPQHNMQPFSPMSYPPCSPMPPQQMHPAFQQTTQLPGGYPCSPAPPQTSMSQQMHPAYHPTAPLPGGYPSSPSRRPANSHPTSQSMQNVNDFLMGPYSNQPFSPAPPVDPSVMSHSSIPLCDGSVMSGSSMMGCPTPDLRPPSVMSRMSYSENVDPNMVNMMQNAAPAQFPPQQPRPIPQQVDLICELFDQERWREAAGQLNLLRKQFDSDQKTDFSSAAKILSRIIAALPVFANDRTGGLIELLGYCFYRFIERFNEKTVMPFLVTPLKHKEPPITLVARIALMPKFAQYFVTPLDTILEYESANELRKALRREDFLVTIVRILASPRAPPEHQYPRKQFQFLLSILSRLATGHEATRDMLTTRMGPQGIIPALLHNEGLVNMCLGEIINSNDPKITFDLVKIVRQVVNLLKILVKKTPRDNRWLQIATDIIAFGGLNAISSSMVYEWDKLGRDFVIKTGDFILFNCCTKHPVLEQRISQIPAPDAECLVTNILYVLRRFPLQHRNHEDLIKRPIPDAEMIYPGHLGAVLNNLCEMNRNAMVVLSRNLKDVVLILAEFNFWFTKYKRFRSDGTVGREFELSFKKHTHTMMDYQDTMVLLVNKIIMEAAKERNLDATSAKLFLETTIRVLEVDRISDWGKMTVRDIVRRVFLVMAKITTCMPQVITKDVLLSTVGFRRENILSTMFNALSGILEYTRNPQHRQEVEEQEREKDEEDKLIMTVARCTEFLGMIYNVASQYQVALVLENIRVLILNNYTPVIMEWLAKVRDFCNRKEQFNSLKKLLSFCEAVSKDRQVAKLWATLSDGWMVSYFEPLCNSQDGELATTAQHVAEELRKHQVNPSDFTSDYIHLMDMDH